MIIPGKVIKRKITIPDLSGNQEDSVAQSDIHFGNKIITLLIGSDLLLRFGYKEEKYNKCLKLLKENILQDKKIFKLEQQNIIQKILILDREIRELINKDKKELIFREESGFKDFIENLKRRGEGLKKLTQKLKFDIIRSHTDFYCKACGGFRSGPDLARKSVPTCAKCKNLLKKITIDRIDNDVVGYLTGYWLEDYIANILNSLSWKAWSSSSLMVYGVSGASHQIDVLATKNGRVLIVECKTNEFTPIQVRNFLGKYYDIRCHKALAVAIGKIHIDGIKIIEKNPAIDYCDNITSCKKLIKKISKI